MSEEEHRTYVRGNFPFRVRYRVVSREEYEVWKKDSGHIFCFDSDTVKGAAGENPAEGAEDLLPRPGMIDMFLMLDEKLDQLLELFAGQSDDSSFFRPGSGLNISGTGMEMLVDKPVEEGALTQTEALLSRLPFVRLEAFGEVVRVTPTNRDDRTLYRLAVEFLDLDPNDRDRIIACIFQKQREAIRKSRSQDSDDE